VCAKKKVKLKVNFKNKRV